MRPSYVCDDYRKVEELLKRLMKDDEVLTTLQEAFDSSGPEAVVDTAAQVHTESGDSLHMVRSLIMFPYGREIEQIHVNPDSGRTEKRRFPMDYPCLVKKQDIR